VLLANRANPNARMLRGNTPLHVAAQVGRDELVGALVAGGADVNTTNDASDTPLHAALEVDAPSRAVVAALVQAGARPDVPNAAGRTSVDLAERAADPALRDLLRPAPAAAAE
jgi:cytohesin